MEANQPAKTKSPLIPELILSLKGYNFQKFLQDLIAGVTVGLVALPLAMAFAISSGLDPKAGISCAIVAGFIISALGGSRLQIGGPTGAFVVVVSGIVAVHGIDGLFMCTMMAGLFLVFLGVSRLGQAVKFIPRPVVLGFTNGIAVLIASTQIKDFLGLKIEKVPSDFIHRMEVLGQNLSSINPQAAGLGLASLATILIIGRITKRVPGTIIALALGTLACTLFHVPIETIGSKFGGIPSGLPPLRIPQFRPDLILPLLAPAFTVAMLGAIESLLSAMVADKMANDRHNPNMELVAQGLANIASPLVGGLPATGAIARTATNIRSGAQTPVSGMIHALTLLLIVLFAAPLAKGIPLALLAAILFVVAYNMGEWKEVPKVLKTSKADAAIWFITFSLTVLADLTVAVQAGMILSVLIFVNRVTTTTTVSQITQEYVERGLPHSLQVNEIPEGVIAFRIHGPFLFGATDKLATIEEALPDAPPVIMLRLRNMTAIDATGAEALTELIEKIRSTGRTAIICGLRSQPSELLADSHLLETLGQDNLCPTLKAGIERANEVLNQTSTVGVEKAD